MGAFEAFQNATPFESLDVMQIAIPAETLAQLERSFGTIDFDPFEGAIGNTVSKDIVTKIANNVSKAGAEKVSQIASLSESINKTLMDLAQQNADKIVTQTKLDIKTAKDSDEIKSAITRLDQNLGVISQGIDNKINQVNTVAANNIAGISEKVMQALNILESPEISQNFSKLIAPPKMIIPSGPLVYKTEDISAIPGATLKTMSAGVQRDVNPLATPASTVVARSAFVPVMQAAGEARVKNPLPTFQSMIEVTPNLGAVMTARRETMPDPTQGKFDAPKLGITPATFFKVSDVLNPVGSVNKDFPVLKDSEDSSFGKYTLNVSGALGVRHYDDLQAALDDQKNLADYGYTSRVREIMPNGDIQLVMAMGGGTALQSPITGMAESLEKTGTLIPTSSPGEFQTTGDTLQDQRLAIGKFASHVD